MSAKGFTLMECLIVLFCLGIFLRTVPVVKEPVLERKESWALEYLKVQSGAMALKQAQIYEGIHFNERGYVEKGRTLSLKKGKVIIRIAQGRLRFE